MERELKKVPPLKISLPNLKPVPMEEPLSSADLPLMPVLEPEINGLNGVEESMDQDNQEVQEDEPKVPPLRISLAGLKLQGEPDDDEPTPSTSFNGTAKSSKKEKHRPKPWYLPEPQVPPVGGGLWDFCSTEGHGPFKYGKRTAVEFDPTPVNNGLEIRCDLPPGRTPLEMVSVLPPTWFGELAYVVRFRNDETGVVEHHIMHHNTFKHAYPQLVIQCYEKNSAFYRDNRTVDELAAAAQAARAAATSKKKTRREGEDSSDSSEDEKARPLVPLMEWSDSTSSSEPESESDMYVQVDLAAEARRAQNKKRKT